jgi:hypothetical protein
VLGLFFAVVIAAGCWFVVRAFEYGIPNVFFRDHHFKDDRDELTESMAVELTRKTLKAEGIDVTSLEPRPVSHDDPLARVLHWEPFHPNEGYVLWGNSSDAEYRVNIEKDGSDVLCRIYRPK